ncbi:MAG: TOBE domain-containing protein, partial [Proteobacteria bacterium]|nr:TOBE domain-containing protein [Pseudomonadota bacterium]
NVLPARIAEVGGSDSSPVIDVRLALREGSLLARVTRRSIAELGLTPGREVFAVIKSIAIDRPGFSVRPVMAPDHDADALDT